MPVTSLHATSGKHYCGEDTVSVEWELAGKRHALWVSAKNGKCHFAGCPARKKSAVSAADMAMVESIWGKRPPMWEAKAWLEMPENQNLIRMYREAATP